MMDHSNPKSVENVEPSTNPSSTTNVPDIKTVKVSNVALAATDKDIHEFFSFSGEIQYVEMQRETETTQLAYVTFKDSQGVETALLLTGATISGLSVSITIAEHYQLPPDALKNMGTKTPVVSAPNTKKAEDVVSTMLAKGFILGKDALNKAKSLDEKHQLRSNASAKVASLDRKIGLTDKLTIGTAVVNEKVKEMDVKYQVSEKTKIALAAAEQKASVAGSAIMSNQYVSTGASWVSNAFNKVAKAAEVVGVMTKVKVEKAEEEKKGIEQREKASMVKDFAHVHLDDSSIEDSPVKSANANKSAPMNSVDANINVPVNSVDANINPSLNSADGNINAPMNSADANKNAPVSSADANKIAPVSSADANKIAPLNSADANKNAFVSSADANTDASLNSADGNKNAKV